MTALLPECFGLLLRSTGFLALGLFALHLTRRRGSVVQSLVGRAALIGVALMLVMTPLADRLPGVWRVTIGEPTPAHEFATSPVLGGGRGSAVLDPLATPSLPTAPSLPVTVSALPVHSRQNEISWINAPTNNAPTLRVQTSSPSRFERGGELVSRGGFLLWALGTTILLLWLGICQWHLTQLRRTADPITSGLAFETLTSLTPRPPCLLSHPAVLSPFLAGIRNPAIFLPPAWEATFDPMDLRAILTHELAHLDRRDNAWTLTSRLLCALLWPQPLLWLLCRCLEQIGEEACDAAVLARDCSPRAYADCLLILAERHSLGRRERALGVGVAPLRSSLGRRIARILNKGTSAMSTTTLRLRLGIAAGAAGAVLGGAFLISSAPAETATTPHTKLQTAPAGTVFSPDSAKENFQPRRAFMDRKLGRQLTDLIASSDPELKQPPALARPPALQSPDMVVTSRDSSKTLSESLDRMTPANLIQVPSTVTVGNVAKEAEAHAITVNDQLPANSFTPSVSPKETGNSTKSFSQDSNTDRVQQLMQQREALQAQQAALQEAMKILKEQTASLTGQTQEMRTEMWQQFQKMSASDIERGISEAQKTQIADAIKAAQEAMTAAQSNLAKKGTTLLTQNPIPEAMQEKIQAALEKAQEKLKALQDNKHFLEEVQDRARKAADLSNQVSDKERIVWPQEALRKQQEALRQIQLQLERSLAALNAQIAHEQSQTQGH